MTSAFKHPSVIINLSSGSASDVSGEMEEAFVKHAYAAPKIHAINSEGLKRVFDEVSRDGTDLLVIYGGDGTCKSGAEVAKTLNIPLIALPGGTMNMLPKALYDTEDWSVALDIALNQTEPRWFPAGRINDDIFFCGAIIGDPIKMADARESVRDGHMAEAIKKVPEVLDAIKDGDPISYNVDGKTYSRDANLLHLFCPVMIGAPETDTRLELAAVPPMSVPDLVAAGARSLISGWRDAEKIDVTRVESLNITGQGSFDILLDGEPARADCPVEIRLEEKGVKVLAPLRSREQS